MVKTDGGIPGGGQNYPKHEEIAVETYALKQWNMYANPYFMSYYIWFNV